MDSEDRSAAEKEKRAVGRIFQYFHATTHTDKEHSWVFAQDSTLHVLFLEGKSQMHMLREYSDNWKI